MRRRLVDMGAPPDRVHIHPLGVDTRRFSPAPRAASPRGRRLHLLSIARLVPKKGIDDALRAVAAVRTRVPDVQFTIIGDGPLRDALESQAQALGIASHVRFAGWLTAPDVIARARTADVILAPSVTAPDGDAEGTPVAILEAQALGVPVVATRHAGIPEVVEDGVTAFLAPEHDVDGLAAAIISLSDPALRARMGEAGRAFVERQHDIAVLNRALVARYQALIRR
jgi:colanic acid/amylovoran biosynthesis glycosyltransferase